MKVVSCGAENSPSVKVVDPWITPFHDRTYDPNRSTTIPFEGGGFIRQGSH